MKRIVPGVLLNLLVIGLPLAATADAPLTTVTIREAAVSWRPADDATARILTILAPDGELSKQRIAVGEEAVFDLFDREGHPVRDGIYHWELRPALAVPDAQRPAAASAGLQDDFRPRQAPVESGAFTIRDGLFVLPGVDEVSAEGEAPDVLLRSQSPDGGPQTRDTVILDDLIVDGSLCAGNTCVNGEVFGDDVLRLEEARVRLHFQDSSSASGFPSNDWRISINDLAAGGSNYFAITDADAGTSPLRVVAGAPDHSLYVSSNGRVGFGTSTPGRAGHMVSGDTPALRLEQDASLAFGTQTWDLAGNEANFFLSDVSANTLPFRVQPGAPTSSLIIDDEGYVGLSQFSPTANLHVNDTTTAAGSRTLVKVSNNGGVRIELEDRSASGNNAWFLRNQNAQLQLVDEVAGDGNELVMDAAGNLTILGTITANGSTFPDYVFEDGYDLMSLDEVAAFIAKEGHLPRIPSAAEVEAEGGHDMTELQLRLLEKIEELTLYTLSQQRELEELSARIESGEQGCASGSSEAAARH